MTHIAFESNLLSIVRSSMPRKLGSNLAYGRVFLVQELNVGTVALDLLREN